MANNLRKFDTLADYQAAELVKPAVSLIAEDDSVYFDKKEISFNGKWLATYQDSHTESAECDSTSAITMGEIETENIVAVEFGDCITTTDEAIFGWHYSLSAVSLGNSIETLAGSLFASTSISEVTIPSTVTSIGMMCFNSCMNLTSVTCLATTPPTIEWGAFDSVNENLIIYVPSESVSAYQAAWTDYASKIQAIS